MNYIITGGEFNNKGAEAMTMITIARIRERDPNARIYIMAKITEEEQKEYSIEVFSASQDVMQYLLTQSIALKLKIEIKNIAKKILGKKVQSVRKAKDVFSNCRFLIDVSGFAISSKFPNLRTEVLLDRILVASKYGAKTVLMPQSFGPFDYKDNKINEKLKEALSQCYLIYAREESGFELLRNLGLNNVRKTNDMVLVQKSINYDLIFKSKKFEINSLDVTRNSVGIVPNIKTIDKGESSKVEVLKLYSSMINMLLSVGYSVYLIPHSTEDIGLCKEINEHNKDKNVYCIKTVMHSYEYQKSVSKLDFIIASRYHAIVHAYKVGTPALILGWAEKYKEIATLFEQSPYIFDISDSIRSDEILNALNDMISRHSANKEKIISHLVEIQKDDYFEFLKNH